MHHGMYSPFKCGESEIVENKSCCEGSKNVDFGGGSGIGMSMFLGGSPNFLGKWKKNA